MVWTVGNLFILVRCFKKCYPPQKISGVGFCLFSSDLHESTVQAFSQCFRLGYDPKMLFLHLFRKSKWMSCFLSIFVTWRGGDCVPEFAAKTWNPFIHNSRFLWFMISCRRGYCGRKLWGSNDSNIFSSSVGMSIEWLTGVSEAVGSRPDVFSCA